MLHAGAAISSATSLLLSLMLLTEAEKGQFVSIAIFHFRMEVCNGSRARMEERIGIFFAGPSLFSVPKRERDTRVYSAFILRTLRRYERISCIMHARMY